MSNSRVIWSDLIVNKVLKLAKMVRKWIESINTKTKDKRRRILLRIIQGIIVKNWVIRKWKLMEQQFKTFSDWCNAPWARNIVSLNFLARRARKRKNNGEQQGRRSELIKIFEGEPRGRSESTRTPGCSTPGVAAPITEGPRPEKKFESRHKTRTPGQEQKTREAKCEAT